MPVEFEPGGQKSSALNGGQEFTFTEAISIVAPCADQAEVDIAAPGWVYAGDWPCLPFCYIHR